MIVMKEFLTTEEVAYQLNVSVGTVKRLLRDGIMPGYKIGNQWRINPQEFQQYLEEQRNKKPEQER